MNRKDFLKTLIGGVAVAAGVKQVELPRAPRIPRFTSGGIVGSGEVIVSTNSKLFQAIASTRDLSIHAWDNSPISIEDLLPPVEGIVEYTADIIVA